MNGEEERAGERRPPVVVRNETARHREDQRGVERVERDVGQVDRAGLRPDDRRKQPPERVRERRVEVVQRRRPERQETRRRGMGDQGILGDERAIIPEEKAVKRGTAEGRTAGHGQNRCAEGASVHFSGSPRLVPSSPPRYGADERRVKLWPPSTRRAGRPQAPGTHPPAGSERRGRLRPAPGLGGESALTVARRVLCTGNRR